MTATRASSLARHPASSRSSKGSGLRSDTRSSSSVGTDRRRRIDESVALDIRFTSRGELLIFEVVLSRRTRRWLLASLASVTAMGGLSTSTIVHFLGGARPVIFEDC